MKTLLFGLILASSAFATDFDYLPMSEQEQRSIMEGEHRNDIHLAMYGAGGPPLTFKLRVTKREGITIPPGDFLQQNSHNLTLRLTRTGPWQGQVRNPTYNQPVHLPHGTEMVLKYFRCQTTHHNTGEPIQCLLPVNGELPEGLGTFAYQGRILYGMEAQRHVPGLLQYSVERRTSFSELRSQMRRFGLEFELMRRVERAE